MIMIYVAYKEKDGEYLVTQFHYMPYHPVYGLGKTEAELLKNGIFIESIAPHPNINDDQYLITKIDLKKKEIYYEIVG